MYGGEGSGGKSRERRRVTGRRVMRGTKDKWGGQRKTEEGRSEEIAKIFISFVIKGNLSFSTFSLSVSRTNMNTNTFMETHTANCIDEI